MIFYYKDERLYFVTYLITPFVTVTNVMYYMPFVLQFQELNPHIVVEKLLAWLEWKVKKFIFKYA